MPDGTILEFCRNAMRFWKRLPSSVCIERLGTIALLSVLLSRRLLYPKNVAVFVTQAASLCSQALLPKV